VIVVSPWLFSIVSAVRTCPFVDAANVIVSGPAVPFAALMASASVPGPEAAVLVTVNDDALAPVAGTASPNATTPKAASAFPILFIDATAPPPSSLQGSRAT
jgi:hypothetical protein